MQEHFHFLIVRVLKKYLPFFKRHIWHEYYKEMSQKPEVVWFSLPIVSFDIELMEVKEQEKNK